MVLNILHFFKTSYLLGVCCLIVSPYSAWATKCDAAHYEAFNGTEVICCKRCYDANKFQPCIGTPGLQEECRCSEGYVCPDKKCYGCVTRTQCGENKWAKRTGENIYGYTCEDCPKGTYSEENKGICRPVQKPTENYTTKEHGITMQSHTVITERVPTVPGYYVAIFISAAFLLLILSVCIHFLIWKRNRTKKLHLEGIQPQGYTCVNPKEDGDSWSCQYPEEEHGEDTIEKPSIC